MNGYYLHLILNHFPVLGSFFGLWFLLFGIIKEDKALIQGAYVIFIFIAIVSIPAFLSGEAAAKAVGSISGINKDWIESHERASALALNFMLGLGAASLISLIIERLANKRLNILLYIVLFLSIIVFLTMLRASFLGGKIRRPELNSALK